jgi:hypothetical protein
MNMKMIGCDPEFFAFDSENGIIPAVEFLTQPIMTDSGFIVADGIAMEFNPVPASQPADLVAHINYLKHTIITRLQEHYRSPSIIFTSSVPVPLDVIERAGKSNASALEFGCSPDLNVYGDNPSYRGDASNIPYRFAGGHIHIDAHDTKCIKCLDMIVGLVINQAGDKENEKLRREYYGKAGVYREKFYGLEWRVPSSEIFGDNKLLLKYITFIDQIVKEYSKIDSFPIANEEEVKEVINSGESYDKAWEWMK